MSGARITVEGEAIEVAGRFSSEAELDAFCERLWGIFFALHPEAVEERAPALEAVPVELCGGMGAVLGDLAEVGYDAEWHCIPASAVGAPHRRDRVWIVANPGGEQHEGDRPPLSGEIAAELSRAAADADRDGQSRSAECNFGEESEFEASRRGDALRCRSGGASKDWWISEPNVGRVAHGIPARVDRLRSLGNAVVPQVVEVIGRALKTHLEARQ